MLLIIGSIAVPDKAIANSQQLQIVSAYLRQIPDASPRNDHELIIAFNRPLTRVELNPAGFLRYPYGIKYWVESYTGWKHEPSSIEGIQEGLARDDNLSYWPFILA
ncbi:hypothetical protein [Thermoleptolyngbya sp. PKUAC-SCTB121]|uniref:hypothetical protein n=1 Tax=Thermoleptolyngbya sp. PKUAC-SCTB121 TaxID=2811482 RepID=UPI001962B482|nr:hypothetical protein [Thermoleptolyngbya sp. PKUAC-SCTB121]